MNGGGNSILEKAPMKRITRMIEETDREARSMLARTAVIRECLIGATGPGTVEVNKAVPPSSGAFSHQEEILSCIMATLSAMRNEITEIEIALGVAEMIQPEKRR